MITSHFKHADTKPILVDSMVVSYLFVDPNTNLVTVHNIPVASFRQRFNPGPPIGDRSNSTPCHPVFVFHLPNYLTNLGLYTLFRTYGKITSCSIVVDRKTGGTKGYGFVDFRYLRDANEAIKHLNGHRLGHKYLKVEHKKPRRDWFDPWVPKRHKKRFLQQAPHYR